MRSKETYEKNEAYSSFVPINYFLQEKLNSLTNEKQLSLTHETLYFFSFAVISAFFHPRCHCSAHIGPPLSFVIPLRL